MKSFAFSAAALIGAVTAVPTNSSSAAAFCQSGYDVCQQNPPNQFYCQQDYTNCMQYNGLQPSQQPTTTTRSSTASIPLNAGTPYMGPTSYPVGPTAYAQNPLPNVTTTTWTTDRVTVPCAGPTSVVQDGKTYTVTAATTFTITDCPCTVTGTKPVPKAGSPANASPVAPGSGSSNTYGTAPVASGAAPSSGVSGSTGGNGTVPHAGSPSASPSTSPSGPVQQVGNSAVKVSGAGFAISAAMFAGMAFLL